MGSTAMKDMQGYLEKLRVQIAECEMIRNLATDKIKQQVFDRLAKHFKTLADELESEIARQPFPKEEESL